MHERLDRVEEALEYKVGLQPSGSILLISSLSSTHDPLLPEDDLSTKMRPNPIIALLAYGFSGYCNAQSQPGLPGDFNPFERLNLNDSVGLSLSNHTSFLTAC